MLFWHLLQALIMPPHQSPLVKRLRFLDAIRDDTPMLPFLHAKRLIPFVRLALLIVLPAAAILFLFPLMLVFYLTTLSYAPVILPALNTIMGALIAFNVAGSIAFEHERKTYDLLALIPMGRFGMHLIYCQNWIRRNQMVFWIIVAFVVIGVGSLMLGIGVQGIFGDTMLHESLIFRLILSAALLIDVLYSFVTAAVVGMWAPAIGETRMNAQLNALAVFGVIQGMAYGAFYVFSGVLIPMFGEQSTQVFIAVLMLAVFFGVREAAIRLLWQSLGKQLNASPDETDVRYTVRAEKVLREVKDQA